MNDWIVRQTLGAEWLLQRESDFGTFYRGGKDDCVEEARRKGAREVYVKSVAGRTIEKFKFVSTT